MIMHPDGVNCGTWFVVASLTPLFPPPPVLPQVLERARERGAAAAARLQRQTLAGRVLQLGTLLLLLGHLPSRQLATSSRWLSLRKTTALVVQLAVSRGQQRAKPL
jgi:hypothetical protein